MPHAIDERRRRQLCRVQVKACRFEGQKSLVRHHALAGLGGADAELALEARRELGGSLARAEHAVGGRDDGRDAALVGNETGHGFEAAPCSRAPRAVRSCLVGFRLFLLSLFLVIRVHAVTTRRAGFAVADDEDDARGRPGAGCVARAPECNYIHIQAAGGRRCRLAYLGIHDRSGRRPPCRCRWMRCSSGLLRTLGSAAGKTRTSCGT